MGARAVGALAADRDPEVVRGRHEGAGVEPEDALRKIGVVVGREYLADAVFPEDA